MLVRKRLLFLLVLTVAALPVCNARPHQSQPSAGPLDRQTTVWGPFLEWSLDNPSFNGNPFDLVATVTFSHAGSETRTTEMFYAGGTTWKFRFTGTRGGVWSFTSTSSDPELDGHTGAVTVGSALPGATGFVAQAGDKWVLEGLGAFVPQFLMWGEPNRYEGDGAQVDAAIQEFLVEHGFTGFHTTVWCGWFGIEERACDQQGSDPVPDFRTFEALELLIIKTHAAGGVVHIWAWGDESRKWTPIEWGINGTVDQRLQRYIAARLGPIPGWTMGYGFDLDEWVSESQLHAWNTFMQDHLGWHHYLGGRPLGPNSGTNHSPWVSWNSAMEYSSYEHHQPRYDVYVAALQAVPGKPVLSEDRFRIRPGSGDPKDYNEEDTRRGLWQSTMAGGVANIWGDLTDDEPAGTRVSRPYANKGEIKTHFDFWQERFVSSLARDNALTDGVALRSENRGYIFYKENTASLQMDLSGMSGSRPAVAVDTKQAPYQEIDLGVRSPTTHTVALPHVSDWAITVGKFLESEIFSDGFESGNTSSWARGIP
jgi:hypothetical protein